MPRPSTGEGPQDWSLLERLLAVEERALGSAGEFVDAARAFDEQPLLWVGAAVRVQDADSFAPLLPAWFEPFRADCEWAADGWAPTT